MAICCRSSVVTVAEGTDLLIEDFGASVEMAQEIEKQAAGMREDPAEAVVASLAGRSMLARIELESSAAEQMKVVTLARNMRVLVGELVY